MIRYYRMQLLLVFELRLSEFPLRFRWRVTSHVHLGDQRLAASRHLVHTINLGTRGGYLLGHAGGETIVDGAGSAWHPLSRYWLDFIATWATLNSWGRAPNARLFTSLLSSARDIGGRRGRPDTTSACRSILLLQASSSSKASHVDLMRGTHRLGTAWPLFLVCSWDWFLWCRSHWRALVRSSLLG